MLAQQARDELAPLARRGERLPLRDLFPAVQRGEAVELRLERGAIGKEVPVLLEQQRDARVQRRVEHDAARSTHARHQRLGHLQLADLF